MKITSSEKLDSANDYLHDSSFNLERIVKSNKAVLVPFDFADQKNARLIKKGLVSTQYRVPLEGYSLKVMQVRDFTIEGDKDQLWGSFDRIFFSEGVLRLTSHMGVTLKFSVESIDIELKKTGRTSGYRPTKETSFLGLTVSSSGPDRR